MVVCCQPKADTGSKADYESLNPYFDDGEELGDVIQAHKLSNLHRR